MSKVSFGVSVETDDASGKLIGVYFQIRTGKVHTTVEFADGDAFADYDRGGNLLGIELLAPCKVSIVDKIAPEEPLELRRKAKRFMRDAGPRKMIAA